VKASHKTEAFFIPEIKVIHAWHFCIAILNITCYDIPVVRFNKGDNMGRMKEYYYDVICGNEIEGETEYDELRLLNQARTAILELYPDIDIESELFTELVDNLYQEGA